MSTKILHKLKSLREKRLWNMQTLADRADVALATVSNAEAGRPISFGTIKKLADALGVAPEKL